MLTIRRAQLDLLGRPDAAAREDRALRHLRNCIPEICDRRTEQELRDIINWGHRRATGYGIDREVDFFRYLNLMFMFGFEFDIDPKYPWAERTLAASEKDSRGKMDLLMDHAMLFCTQNQEVPAQ